MVRRTDVLRLSLVVWSALSVGVSGGTALAAPCDEGSCYAYGQFLRTEREQATSQGYMWVAPRDLSPLVMIRTLPSGSALPPVDDEIHLRTNGRRLWSVVYPGDKAPESFTQAALDLGANNIDVWYQNTAGSNAHFFIQIGGIAFNGSPNYGREYREGSSFGTGLINKSGGVIASAQVWRSKVEPPNKPVNCTCQGLP